MRQRKIRQGRTRQEDKDQGKTRQCKASKSKATIARQGKHGEQGRGKGHLEGAEGRSNFAHGSEGRVDGDDEVAVGIRA